LQALRDFERLRATSHMRKLNAGVVAPNRRIIALLRHISPFRHAISALSVIYRKGFFTMKHLPKLCNTVFRLSLAAFKA
jgi:hypothetical protein